MLIEWVCIRFSKEFEILTLIGKFPGYELDRFMENLSKTEEIAEK